MYNGERYLQQAIDSVLSQSYGHFELLLVDDCSTDASRAIAEAYASQDSRVQIIANRVNLGLVPNWNRCAQLARGEWIKFVFQDDTIHPECLTQVLSLAGSGVPLIACQRSVIFGDGIEPYFRQWYVTHRAMINKLFAGQDVLSAECCQRLALEYFGINLFGEPSAVIVHRSAFERFGLFNPSLIMSCDLELWTRISIHAGAAVVPHDLAIFRVHKDATSASHHARREFRTNVLDNLVILHQYAFDELYAPLRRAAAGLSPPVDLKGIFDKRRHEARARAEWAANRRSDADPSLLFEWKEVSKHYPRIAGRTLDHLLWRLRRHLFSAQRSPMPSGAAGYLA
jgi:hypothetical protein